MIVRHRIIEAEASTAFCNKIGHKRKLERVRSMSALPPKADIAGRELDVRFVPEADVARSCVCVMSGYPMASSQLHNGVTIHFELRASLIWSEGFDQFFQNVVTHFRLLELKNKGGSNGSVVKQLYNVLGTAGPPC